MLGLLPTKLEINSRQFDIRSDYRNILCIFEAFADDQLTSEDKLFICLKRLYTHL